MVIPIEEKGEMGKTLEDRLAFKFDEMQMSREQRNHLLFDEIARSIEILLRAVPNVYTQYIAEKTELDKDKALLDMEIEDRVRNAPDKITAGYIQNVEGYQNEWEYRETLEEYIMELLSMWKLVVTRQEDYARIEPAPQETPTEKVAEVEFIDEPEIKKPRLSIKK